MRTFDVAIVGLGAMGSAAAYHLARRGARVVGLDRFTPPHTLGSTHGRTRITREAYFESPLYVPIIRRAYECWAELEAASGRTLFLRTGGLMVGPADGMLVSGARRSAVEHGLAHELLSADEIRRRFPGLAPSDDVVGLLEARAGLLFPEPCVATHLELAQRHGAELHFDTLVRDWTADGDGVRVTAHGGELRATRLILAAGPWLPELLEGLELSLEVERQLFHWFEPAAHPELFAPDRCPIALWEYAPDRLFATFPDLGDGVKFGVHHEGERAHPDRVRRAITPEEDDAARSLLAAAMPEAAGRLREARVCLYTNTPDRHFLIDRHPDAPQVLLASPCSGHGFKFSSAIGEVLADLAIDGRSRFDLSAFGVERLR